MHLPSAWAPGPFPGLPDEVWGLSKRSPQVEERPQWCSDKLTFHSFRSCGHILNTVFTKCLQGCKLGCSVITASLIACLKWHCIDIYATYDKKNVWIHLSVACIMQNNFPDLTSYGHVWIAQASQHWDSICLLYRQANWKQMLLVRCRLMLDLAYLYCRHEREREI